MEGGQVQLRRDLNSGGQPQAHTFTYQSSTVTYGGINGAYYTASNTRRTGSDGVSWFLRKLQPVVLGIGSDDNYVSCRSLWKKARKQIQQLKRPLIESPEESMIR